MDNTKIIVTVTFVILALVATFICGRCSKHCTSKEVIKHTTDTVYVVKSYKADTIVRKARIILRDTINQVGATIIDTFRVESFMDSCYTALEEFITAKHDTVKIEYLHPERLFKNYINYSKDSTKVIRDNTEITKYIENTEPWWHKPAMITGSIIGGFFLGRIFK